MSAIMADKMPLIHESQLENRPPSPQFFVETVHGFQRTEALKAAVALELFTAMAKPRRHCGSVSASSCQQTVALGVVCQQPASGELSHRKTVLEIQFRTDENEKQKAKLASHHFFNSLLETRATAN